MCIQLGVSIPLYLAAKDMYTMIADSTNISIKYLHNMYTVQPNVLPISNPPPNQNKCCLAIFWFNELPFKRLKIDYEFSTTSKHRDKIWARLSTIIFMSKPLRSTGVPPFFMHHIYVYNWCVKSTQYKKLAPNVLWFTY